MPKIARWVMAPERIQEGLRITRDTLHANGVTTLHEPGTGVFSVRRPEDELKMLAPLFNAPDTPMRTLLSPRAEMVFARFHDDAPKAIDFMNKLREQNLAKVAFVARRANLYVDGSYVDQAPRSHRVTTVSAST